MNLKIFWEIKLDIVIFLLGKNRFLDYFKNKTFNPNITDGVTNNIQKCFDDGIKINFSCRLKKLLMIIRSILPNNIIRSVLIKIYYCTTEFIRFIWINKWTALFITQLFWSADTLFVAKIWFNLKYNDNFSHIKKFKIVYILIINNFIKYQKKRNIKIL
jgi:hypothetical protein